MEEFIKRNLAYNEYVQRKNKRRKIIKIIRAVETLILITAPLWL